MSTSPTPIAIVITDGVDSSIVTKIQAIGIAATQSQTSIDALQASIASLSGSGITELKAQIDSASGSLTQLKSSASGASTEQKNLAGATNDLTQAQNSNSSATQNLANIMLQQLDASKALAAAKRDLANAEKTLGQAAAGGSASAKQIIQGYRDQYLSAATLVANLRQARAEAGRFKQSQEEIVPALNNTVSANQAASGAIRVLEGNFGTSVRAGENFLTKILGFGPALQAAFPMIGAIALLGVIDMLIDHIDKAIAHFKTFQVDSVTAELVALANNQVTLKGQKSEFLADRQQVPAENISDPSIVIEQTQAQLRLKTAIDGVTEANKQGLSLQQAKEQVTKNEINNTIDAIASLQKQRKAIQDELTAVIHTSNSIPDQTGGSIEVPGEDQLKFPQGSEQRQQLTQFAKEYDSAIRQLTNDMQNLIKAKLPTLEQGEGLKALKDQAKEAREQIKEFDDALAQLKTHQNIFDGGATTDKSLQQQLNLLNDEAATTLPQNLATLQAKIATVTGEINRHAQVVGSLFEKYQDAATNVGLYSDALKEANEFDKEMLKLKKDGVELNEQQIQSLQDVIKYVTESTQYQSELKRIYIEFNSPLRNYIAAFQAIHDLEYNGNITANQALQAQNQALKSYNDAISPLNEYANGLQNQIELFGKYGIALTVATQVQQVNEQLRQKGLSLTSSETEQLTKLLTLLEQQKELQQDINNLYNQNEGQRQKLLIQEQSLAVAKQKGIISEEQFNVQLAQTATAIANLNIQMGKFTKSDVLTSVFGSYLKDFKGFTVGVTQLWQQTFTTISDGAANALGRAIAYGENLGTALKDVARQALSEIIAGMIKLGIQLLINTVIAQGAQSGLVAASLASATALASAWWDVASAVSLATFGANAAPAAAGMISTATLGELLASVSGIAGKAAGGLITGPGGPTSDSVLIRASDREYMLRAAAVSSIGVPTLEYMNRTGQVPSAGPKITVLHDGTTGIMVQPISENEVRVYARQEARKIVHSDTPGVVATHIADPNSPVSKAVQRNTTARRSR